MGKVVDVFHCPSVLIETPEISRANGLKAMYKNINFFLTLNMAFIDTCL